MKEMIKIHISLNHIYSNLPLKISRIWLATSQGDNFLSWDGERVIDESFAL